MKAAGRKGERRPTQADSLAARSVACVSRHNDVASVQSLADGGALIELESKQIAGNLFTAATSGE